LDKWVILRDLRFLYKDALGKDRLIFDKYPEKSIDKGYEE